MVIDNLKDTSTYEHINPLFKKAFDFLRSTDFAHMEATKIELEGKNLFAMISDSDLKSADMAKLEVHNEYIDIQIPIDKIETFGWMARSDLKLEVQAYDAERDIQFFEDKIKTFFSLSPGNIAIFFPGDAHAPCIGVGKVRKVVVKIKVRG